jgi:type I restriction enzyme S subunit
MTEQKNTTSLKGTKQSVSLIPKLRFKEFEEEWENLKLNDLTSLITKGTTPKKFTSSGVNYVKIEGLKGININKTKCLFIDKEIHFKELKRSILQENDLLFAIAGATVGKVGIVTSDILPANTNQALAIIRLKNIEYLDYILQILQSRVMKKYIYQSVSVGAQPNLNLEQIGNFKFNIPSVKEQQKIASFLTSVDTKIQQLTTKKQLLENYKKGVMQQLFSQQLRFKNDDGLDFPDWEEKKLGEVCKLQGGYAFKSNQFQKQGIPIIRISNISNNNNFIDKKNIVYYKDFEINNNYILSKNDLIVAMSGATTGKASIYNLNIKGFVNQRVGVFRPTKSLLNKFLTQFVFSNNFSKQLDKVLVAGAQPNISSNDIESFKINIPSLKEQQKIANYLSAIDTKIENVQTQIEKTQAFKKGLLQQMFV